MSRGIPNYFAHSKYNISPCDIRKLLLHCESEKVREKVIITLCWSENFLADVADNIDTVAEEGIYEVSYNGDKFTLVHSGMGAPQTGDIVLALGCTPCQFLIFTGSFGGLTEKISIGDLLVGTESISGDGFSIYLKEGPLSARSFLEPVKPDADLNELLEEYAVAVTREKTVTLHKDRVFSSDTIVAEHFHFNTMTEKYGCIGVEMETSAVFNAAALVSIRAASLLMVSDVIPVNKSLFSGRTEVDRTRRKYVRGQVLSRIILDTLCNRRLN